MDGTDIYNDRECDEESKADNEQLEMHKIG